MDSSGTHTGPPPKGPWLFPTASRPVVGWAAAVACTGCTHPRLVKGEGRGVCPAQQAKLQHATFPQRGIKFHALI